MRVIRHPEVSQELEAAALWYEERQPGLGTNFIEEYQATLGRILNEPERWRKIRDDNRKLNFRRFPYAIIYSVRGEALFLKPVMHLHRRPLYWQNRV
jgi:ParE toxin of type II toxin-antitoxin system, parDE